MGLSKFQEFDGFKHAVPFNLELSDEMMLDAQGKRWTWLRTRQDLKESALPSYRRVEKRF